MEITIDATTGAPANTVRLPNLLPTDESQTRFATLCATFDAAWTTHPAEAVETWYTLAGKRVRMRMIGHALAATYHRAFAPPCYAHAARDEARMDTHHCARPGD